MLVLKNIKKNYQTGENKIEVLKNVDVCFRQHELVAVLGPSGCGKTTLLNIIGGLDRYTSGDIVIDGISTKDYREHDWDIYRNHRVGFVFQSYNLIPHLTVARNVELSLTLSGISKSERRQRAIQALDRVGLKDQAKKKPSQMSGGQMQRVAIARAIVNDPDIILADEPTGALDSEAGIQVMQLLKEISKERLVIMVTHNDALAYEYSTRIIDLKDGTVTSDSAPYSAREEQQPAAIGDIVTAAADAAQPESSRRTLSDKRAEKKARKQKLKEMRARQGDSAMSYGTALSLSCTNLLNKKGRTALTSFAGSIGIIGIMLVIALSNGAAGYISAMEEDALSQYPLKIERTNMDLNAVIDLLLQDNDTRPDHPDGGEIYIEEVLGNLFNHLNAALNDTNDLKKFKAYIEDNFDNANGYVKYDYGTKFDVFCNYIGDEEKYMKVNPFLEGIQDSLPGASAGLIDKLQQFGDLLTVWDEMIDDPRLLDSQYELLGGKWASSYNEVVIVVDEKNQLDDYTLFALGLKSADEHLDAMEGGDFANETFKAEDLIGIEYRITTGSDYCYQNEDGSWGKLDDRDDQRRIEFIEGKNSEGEDNSVAVKVVGVVRPRKGTAVTSINGNIGYTHHLSEYLSERASSSPAYKAQLASPDKDIVTGKEIDKDELKQIVLDMGVADMENPMSISFYASSFDNKEAIEAFIAQYNADSRSAIKYSDDLGTVMGYVDSLTGTVTGVLIGFASISLIVSSIMIAIIIYTSVLERRKEIGVLRSMGARKSDISHVFIAESVMIGLVSGVLGVVLAFAMTIPINIVLEKFLMVGGLITMKWWHALAMVGVSVLLAIIAGSIPSRIAAKKDPVECLRTE